MFNTLKEARVVTQGLSEPSKMPGFSYNLPASACVIGSLLQKIAGSTCNTCYAMKGRYTFGVVKAAMARRLEAIRHPLWVEAMAFEINFHAKRSIDGSDRYFRWHDSGDLQDLDHLEMINDICRQTPDVKHWLPTREMRIVREYMSKHGSLEPNLFVRISAPMVGKTMKGIPGLPVSTVGMPLAAGQQCQASKHGGKCGSCRACWSGESVNYPLH
jgi:hypothetical protein